MAQDLPLDMVNVAWEAEAFFNSKLRGQWLEAKKKLSHTVTLQYMI